MVKAMFLLKCKCFTMNTISSVVGFFHGWKFSLFNFSWVDILAFGATLHRICIVEEILVELILAF